MFFGRASHVFLINSLTKAIMPSKEIQTVYKCERENGILVNTGFLKKNVGKKSDVLIRSGIKKSKKQIQKLKFQTFIKIIFYNFNIEESCYQWSFIQILVWKLMYEK